MVPESLAFRLRGRAITREVGIDPRDRGFTLGDGVFETIKVVSGVPLRWRLHADRLRDGLRALQIGVDASDDDLRAAVGNCIASSGTGDGVVRLSVSRGAAASRGLLPGVGSDPAIIVEVRPPAGYPETLAVTGMSAVFGSVPRNERSPLSRIKSLSYLENVLARMEAHAAGADEAIVLNTAGIVAGASAANVFAVLNGEIATPPDSDGALPGTMRRWVIEKLAPVCGLSVREQSLTPVLLAGAEEILLTNALMGVVPVTVLQGDPVGAGCPGPVTGRLAAVLSKLEAAEARAAGM